MPCVEGEIRCRLNKLLKELAVLSNAVLNQLLERAKRLEEMVSPSKDLLFLDP
jgi:hypothetical protein